jgi:hypothetical protein
VHFNTGRPLAIGTASHILFGSIALATLGGTILGTIGALWVVPALLPSRRRVEGRE